MKVRSIVFLVSLLVLALGAGPALAGAPTNYVRTILDQVIAIQNDPAMSGPAKEPERAKAIRAVIQRSFDFSLMAQNSLGAAYGKLSQGQRQEFISVFSALFQDSYTRMVLNFLKQETITYGQEREEGGKARVHTTIVRTNETIPVEYLMHSQAGGWRLYDVIVDGVSILDNYQRTFKQVIDTKSFDFLLNRMKTQQQAIKVE
ncbi:MAG: ABC transporter substrate-binding protein [Deltaproteobacteria bacterium]|nr:ABC transporter substrate-binding protein [Deltaproteobacteria bacterium]